MKINEIIKEANTFAKPDSITSSKIIEKYKSVLIRYIEHDVMIYRGTRKEVPELFVSDGSTMQRKAANTTNITNTLTSILPSWQNWPSRPSSFICSLNKSYTKLYGKTYIVVPLENQPIAVSNAEDFWNSLPVGLGNSDVSDFNTALEILFGLPGSTYEVEDIEDDAKLIISATDQILANSDDETIEKYLSKLSNFYKFICIDIVKKLKELKSASSFYDSVLNPAVNNRLYKTFDIVPPGKGEVWMSGKVLFIDEYLWPDIQNKLLEV